MYLNRREINNYEQSPELEHNARIESYHGVK